MDGRFDDDKSLVFVGGMNRTQTLSNIGQDVVVPLISLRIAPSVDNGLTGIIGAREIINRMQLVMRSLSTFTTGTGVTFLINLRLNGRVSAGQFSSVGGSSLAQLAVHPANTTIVGGENVFGFYSNAGVNTEDLNQVRDLGTCILGGGNTLTCPTTFANLYPDGPDIITITATNVTTVTTNSILARISWTEAQVKMSSRVSLQNFVSTSAPVGVTLGDEWFNPTTGILYKRIASSVGVQWVAIATFTGTETLTNKTLTNPTVTNYTESRFVATVTGNAIRLSLDNGTFQTITTMVGANAITLPALGAGKSLTVQVLYASTPTTLTFATPAGTLKWPGGTAPTPTLTNTKYDFYTFVSDGTNWYGIQAAANF
jgi:hypothetical protein